MVRAFWYKLKQKEVNCYAISGLTGTHWNQPFFPPVPIQMQLHACNAWIHSLQDLHQLAGYYTKQQEKWTI